MNTRTGDELLQKMCEPCKNKVKKTFGDVKDTSPVNQARLAVWFLRNACRKCQSAALEIARKQHG